MYNDVFLGTAKLIPHSEFLIPNLSQLCSVRNVLVDENYPCIFADISGNDHSLALYAAELCRREVCYYNNFLSDEVLGLIPFCNARNYLSAAHSVIELKFKELLCLRYFLTFLNFRNSKVNLAEIIN